MQRLFFPSLIVVLLAGPAQAQTTSSTAPVSCPDLSTPKSTLLAAYSALRAGDADTTRKCLTFKDAGETELFDITFSQLYAPLQLMHAMEGKFGPAARQPFANVALERSLEATLAQVPAADIRITGDTAVIVDKKAEVNPSLENQLTGIAFKQQNGEWKIVAGTLTDVADTGAIPPGQLAMMRIMRNAVEGACKATLAKLQKGDFKSVEEAYSDYQGRIQAALQAGMSAGAPASAPAPATQK